jgi:hypothetical protein
MRGREKGENLIETREIAMRGGRERVIDQRLKVMISKCTVN